MALNDYLTAERVLLLDAINDGDMDSIRALTNIDWNFVYPPAVVDTVTGARDLDAWCRTPLCLLVRPDEGNLECRMPDTTQAERQELIERNALFALVAALVVIVLLLVRQVRERARANRELSARNREIEAQGERLRSLNVLVQRQSE